MPPVARDEALAERLRARIAHTHESEIARLLGVDERTLCRVAAGGRSNRHLVDALRARLDALDAAPEPATTTSPRRRRSPRPEGT